METSSVPLKQCSSKEGCIHPDGPYLPATDEYFNPDKRKKYGVAAQCRDCANTYKREWNKAHPERARASAAKYRSAQVQHREYNRRYRAKNPEKSRVYAQRHLTRKRQLPVTLTEADWLRALNYFNGCCAICRRPPGLWHTISADHWIALSDQCPDNPGTVPTNIIPLCFGTNGCNNSKRDKDPVEWLQSKFNPREVQEIIERIEVYFSWVESQDGY